MFPVGPGRGKNESFRGLAGRADGREGEERKANGWEGEKKKEPPRPQKTFGHQVIDGVGGGEIARGGGGGGLGKGRSQAAVPFSAPSQYKSLFFSLSFSSDLFQTT